MTINMHTKPAKPMQVGGDVHTKPPKPMQVGGEPRQMFTCPVCLGSGMIRPADRSSTTDETCGACDGRGYLA